MGYNNNAAECKLGDRSLKTTDCERDLGALIHSWSKFSEQCGRAIKSANSALGIIPRNITCKNKNIITRSTGKTEIRISCASLKALFEERYWQHAMGTTKSYKNDKEYKFAIQGPTKFHKINYTGRAQEIWRLNTGS